VAGTKSGDSVYQVELGGAGGLARRGRTVEVVGVVDSIGWVGGAAWFRAGTG
jgi:hypothetical protein